MELPTSAFRYSCLHAASEFFFFFVYMSCNRYRANSYSLQINLSETMHYPCDDNSRSNSNRNSKSKGNNNNNNNLGNTVIQDEQSN